MEMGRSDSQDTLNTRFLRQPIRCAAKPMPTTARLTNAIENKALGRQVPVGPESRAGEKHYRSVPCVDWVTRVLSPPSE